MDEVLTMNNANAARPPARPPRVVKQTIGERRDDFIGMISKEESAEAAATTEAAAAAVLAAKASNATNGLATSTFLVCARLRPAFESELAEGGESFECVKKTATVATKEAVEEVTVLLPKLSLRGDPKLEKSKFALDHAFGQAASNDEVFAALGRPLVAKAFAGEVGVIFAYGQTGSGKTFTMSAMMDRVVAELFPSDGASDAATARAARFSYLEILGSAVHDCLGPAAANGASGGSDVQIGEALDGRVLTRNLSAHDVRSAAELERLLGVAKSRRATAPTERNATSSRSHGGSAETAPTPAPPSAPPPLPSARLPARLGGGGLCTRKRRVGHSAAPGGGQKPEAPGRAQGEHRPRLDQQARRGHPEHRPARLRH